MQIYFESVYQEIKKHAIQEFPNEMCGVIIQGKTKLIYQKCRNTVKNKTECFEMDPRDFIRAESRGEIKAIVHSHDNYPHASKVDMEDQIRMGIPYGIVFMKNKAVQGIAFWGDELPVQDYIGRPFVHGIYDCYALLRDYHRKDLGIVINQYPREYKWWKKDENLLFNNFQDAGFNILHKESKDIKRNDCILAKVHSKFINHCGVYLGGGLLLHHLCLRSSSLSRTEPITSIDYKQITHIIRHKDV